MRTSCASVHLWESRLPLFPQAVSLPDFGEDWAAREGEICGQSLGWLQRRMSAQWRAQNWSKEMGSLLAAFALVLTHGYLMIRALTLFFLDPSGFLLAPPPSSVLFPQMERLLLREVHQQLPAWIAAPRVQQGEEPRS